MTRNRTIVLLALCLVLASLACRAEINSTGSQSEPPTGQLVETPTSLPPAPVQAGGAESDEPAAIYGTIPYTSPSFLNSASEPFVLLEDEAGFVNRDLEFEFPLAGQVMGPVTIQDDLSLTYDLALPSVPQGTYVDVDNDGAADKGVQVFAVAYWDNTWGGPFLEERDGTGWSTAYSSTIIDPTNDEITGGTLVVWAPDDQQAFPTDFGADGLLFTADDPTTPIPAGYSLVDLDQSPFRFYKEPRPKLDLNEGVIAVNDYSGLSYSEAFDTLFLKASKEYPFTAEKNVDWMAIYERIKPLVDKAKSSQDFYKAIREFTFSVPDGHIGGLTLDPELFYNESGGSFGMILTELSDGRVIVTDILSGTPAEETGIQPGAEIVSWQDLPVQEAIDKVVPTFGPYSTEHARHLAQVMFLTRVPPGSRVNVAYKNPNETFAEQTNMTAIPEYDSLFQAYAYTDQPILPIDAEVLQPSGLGYIRINTFSDDYHLMAQLWERYIQDFKDNEVPGIILDLRTNGGGNSNLANLFAGYFFDEDYTPFRRAYFSDKTGKFETEELRPSDTIQPAPLMYDVPIVVLVGPDCASACEGFAYVLQQGKQATVIGNYPTAGMFGEVNRGQYSLPDDMSLQFPTGRPETSDGEVPIEGVGVIPDIIVPVTLESALGQEDTILQAAIQALLDKIQ